MAETRTTLTLSKLAVVLPVFLRKVVTDRNSKQKRMLIYLVGPPGTGKTYNSKLIAESIFGPELVSMVDGGSEADWKQVKPWEEEGVLKLGMAARASGYAVQNNRLVKVRSGGTLIIDEANRVEVSLKSIFQLIASEQIVTHPTTGEVYPLDCAILSTSNEGDHGVEESSGAELDRYNAMFTLMPTEDEMAKIVSANSGQSMEVAKLINRFVALLSSKLDATRYIPPRGMRHALSIASLIDPELFSVLSLKEIFESASERCWPLGKRGADKYRSEFSGIVSAVAVDFEKEVAPMLGRSLVNADSSASNTANDSGDIEEVQAVNFSGLFTAVSGDGKSLVKTKEFIALPRRISQVAPQFIASFGFGAYKIALQKMQKGEKSAKIKSMDCKIQFGDKDHPDTIGFFGTDRVKVRAFAEAMKALEV